MNQNVKIFGAKASVYLKYNGEMKNLASLLTKELQFPEFYFDTDMDEPHEVFGMCETFGFEMWLHTSTFKEFSFLLTIETGQIANEIPPEQMYDLSPWLARLISVICDIDCYIFYPETGEGFLFEKRNPEIH